MVLWFICNRYYGIRTIFPFLFKAWEIAGSSLVYPGLPLCDDLCYTIRGLHCRSSQLKEFTPPIATIFVDWAYFTRDRDSCLVPHTAGANASKLRKLVMLITSILKFICQSFRNVNRRKRITKEGARDVVKIIVATRWRLLVNSSSFIIVDSKGRTWDVFIQIVLKIAAIEIFRSQVLYLIVTPVSWKDSWSRKPFVSG